MCARFWVTSRRSFCRWLSAPFLACLLLVFCAPTLTAQSTTPELPPPDTKPKNVLVWPQDLLTLYLKIRSLQDSSATLAEQVATLQSQLNDSEAIQQMLSSSLGDSLTRLASLDQAAKQRAKLDQRAVDQARGQNMAWAGGGFLVGAMLTAVTVWWFAR